MPNPYMNTYAPNGFEAANQQTIANQQAQINPVFQNIGAQQNFQNQEIQQGRQLAQQAGQSQGSGGMSSLNPLAMAMMLRQSGTDVGIPSPNTPQMTGVAGMGNSMGTGLTQNSFNSGVGFNPSAQTGGYGIKF